MINTEKVYDLDKTIWRYMDLWKFEALVKNGGELFFTRADKFEDTLEGELSSKTLKKIEKGFLEKYGENFLKNWKSLHYFDSDYIKAVKRNSLVNCWHINEEQNPKMWDSYTTSAESIAIKTTARKLFKALNISDNNSFNIIIGDVKYIDFYKSEIDYTNILAPLFFKDYSYSYEKELRVIVYRRPENNILKTDLSNFNVKKGGSLKIDLNELIDDIYISPNSNSKFNDKIKNIVHNL